MGLLNDELFHTDQDFTTLSGSEVVIEAFGIPGTLGRWSQCHYWAGSPTWQMTRRILGADCTLHDGEPVIRIAVYPGRLEQAAGRLAFPGADWADITWKRKGEGIYYQVVCPAPWTLLRRGRAVPCAAGATEFRLSHAKAAFVP